MLMLEVRSRMREPTIFYRRQFLEQATFGYELSSTTNERLYISEFQRNTAIKASHNMREVVDQKTVN